MATRWGRFLVSSKLLNHGPQVIFKSWNSTNSFLSHIGKNKWKYFLWLSWCIKDLWGTKVMYCYVVKLLFLTLQSCFPNPAATSINSEVLGLPRMFLIRRPWDVKVDGASIKSEPFVTSRLRRPPFFTKKIFSVRHLIQSGFCHESFKRLRMDF